MALNKFIKGIGIISLSAAMLSAAACGKGGTTPSNTPTVNTDIVIKIADYAEEFTYNKSRTAVTSTAKITKIGGTEFVSSRGGLIYYSDEAGYGVYNLKKDKIILSGLGALPNETVLAGVPVLRTSNASGSQSLYDYTSACDGTKLLTDCLDYYPSGMVAELTISGDTEKSEILILTANVLRGGEEARVTKYFKIVRDAQDGEITELTGVLESGIATDSGYGTGNDYNALSRTPVYGGEVDGAIAEYTYGAYGNSYVFYNGAGKETGTVRLADSRVLGFVSNYMYYVTTVPVYPEATSGFNYISDGEKFLNTLNRYDVINNTVSTVTFDAVITGFKPLYNCTKKAYDAVVVRGYGQSNGVAYKGYNGFCHLTDDQLRSAYDLDRFGGVNALYSLGKDSYYLNNYIVNAQLSVQTAARAEDLYPEQGLVAIRNSRGLIGFTDFNGKILMTPEYAPDTSCPDYSQDEPVKFYGDTAYLFKRTESGAAQKVLIKKSGIGENLNEKELDTPSKKVGITVYGGFYLMLTTEITATRTVYTYEYYAFNGTKLLAVTGENSVGVRCEKVGDSYVIILRQDGETIYYKVV